MQKALGSISSTSTSKPTKITKKRGWQSGSSCRAPAYQLRGPEFKPQYHQKKKTIKINLLSKSQRTGT
jgi:hypothetical protein